MGYLIPRARPRYQGVEDVIQEDEGMKEEEVGLLTVRETHLVHKRQSFLVAALHSVCVCVCVCVYGYTH